MIRDSGSVKLYCDLASGWASPSGFLQPWLFPVRALRLPAGPRECEQDASPAAVALRAAHHHACPRRTVYPLRRRPLPRAPSFLSPVPGWPLPVVSFGHNSWPCACWRWPLSWSRPTLHAPTLSPRFLIRSSEPPRRTPKESSDGFCENPRWYESPAHCPQPKSETPHLRATAAESCANCKRPRNSRRPTTWSSCVDHMAAGPRFSSPYSACIAVRSNWSTTSPTK